jgi:hypothetical protein
MGATFEGLDEINEGLTRLAVGSREAATKGAFKAGLTIQRDSMANTPVEYNNLRPSAYTRREGDGAVVGYDAEYAVYVHENMEAKLKGEPRPSGLGTYWNPGGPKFLENAVTENRQTVLGDIAAELEKVLRG